MQNSKLSNNLFDNLQKISKQLKSIMEDCVTDARIFQFQREIQLKMFLFKWSL